MNTENILKAMISACTKASKEIMEIYNRDFKINIKEDNSPVTEADLASNKIIKKELSVFDEIGWLSEEDIDNEARFSKDALFIIDPLDGTQDFVNKDGSFGINIALVYHQKPLISVIGVPASNTYAYAIKGKGAFLHQNNKNVRLHVSNRTKDLIIVQSMTHVTRKDNSVVKKHADLIKEVRKLGASTKAIALANGEVDCSIRYTDKTKEWDVCAPELIVKEAGGIFVTTKGEEFTYNRKDVYNHDGYAMFNQKENMILLS